MNKLEFFIPAKREKNGNVIPLPGTNEIIDANRKGKQVGARLKASEQKRAGWYIKKAMAEQKWQAPEEPVFINCFWHEKNRRRDFDNITGYQKYLLDTMVEVGAIKNDNQKYIAEPARHKVIIDSISPGVYVAVFTMDGSND